MLMKDACGIVDRLVKSEQAKIALTKVLFKDYFNRKSEEVNVTLSELVKELEDIRDTKAVGDLLDAYIAITTPSCMTNAPAKTRQYVLKVAENRGIVLRNRMFTVTQANEIIAFLRTLPKKEEQKPVRLLSSVEMSAIEKRLWG